MKKTLIFCMSLLTVTFLFMTVFEVYADSNQSLCKEWCNQHKELCQKCSDKVGCGLGYQSIVTFKIGPDHWHACRGSEKYKQACEDWCKQHKQCVKCEPLIGCGVGYVRLMSFRGPGGKDWHACGKTAYKKGSEEAKAECIAWCNAHKPQCAKCDTHVGCGLGYKPIKSFGFGEKGDNWFACQKR